MQILHVLDRAPSPFTIAMSQTGSAWQEQPAPLQWPQPAVQQRQQHALPPPQAQLHQGQGVLGGEFGSMPGSLEMLAAQWHWEQAQQRDQMLRDHLLPHISQLQSAAAMQTAMQLQQAGLGSGVGGMPSDLLGMLHQHGGFGGSSSGGWGTGLGSGSRSGGGAWGGANVQSSGSAPPFADLPGQHSIDGVRPIIGGISRGGWGAALPAARAGSAPSALGGLSEQRFSGGGGGDWGTFVPTSGLQPASSFAAALSHQGLQQQVNILTTSAPQLQPVAASQTAQFRPRSLSSQHLAAVGSHFSAPAALQYRYGRVGPVSARYVLTST